MALYFKLLVETCGLIGRAWSTYKHSQKVALLALEVWNLTTGVVAGHDFVDDEL